MISEMGGEQHASLVENAKGHPKFKDFLLVFLAQPGIDRHSILLSASLASVKRHRPRTFSNL